jgi:hypothetical protein
MLSQRGPRCAQAGFGSEEDEFARSVSVESRTAAYSEAAVSGKKDLFTEC